MKIRYAICLTLLSFHNLSLLFSCISMHWIFASKFEACRPLFAIFFFMHCASYEEFYRFTVTKEYTKYKMKYWSNTKMSGVIRFKILLKLFLQYFEMYYTFKNFPCFKSPGNIFRKLVFFCAYCLCFWGHWTCYLTSFCRHKEIYQCIQGKRSFDDMQSPDVLDFVLKTMINVWFWNNLSIRKLF